MNFDWYPFNPTEYRRDTYHLCAAACGIYRRLIDEYMLSRKPLPDNDASLAGIARVTIEEWSEHAAVIRAFFQPIDGKLFHKRCEKEMNAQRMLQAFYKERARIASYLRWGKNVKPEELQWLKSCKHPSSYLQGMLYGSHNTRQVEIKTEIEKTENNISHSETVSPETTAKPKPGMPTPALLANVKSKGWAR